MKSYFRGFSTEKSLINSGVKVRTDSNENSANSEYPLESLKPFVDRKFLVHIECPGCVFHVRIMILVGIRFNREVCIQQRAKEKKGWFNLTADLPVYITLILRPHFIGQ